MLSCLDVADDEKSSLQRSFSLAAPTINGEYHHRVQQLGEAFVEGDHYARLSLENICKALEDLIIDPLRHACEKKGSQNDDVPRLGLGRILSYSNNEKARTVACLKGLAERLMNRERNDRISHQHHHHQNHNHHRIHHRPSCINNFTFSRNCNSRSSSTGSRPVSPFSPPSSSRRSSLVSTKPIPISYPNSNASSRQNSCGQFLDPRDSVATKPGPRKPNVVDVSWVEYDDDDDLQKSNGADNEEDSQPKSPTQSSPMDNGSPDTRCSYVPPSALEETKLSVSAASPNARGFLYRSMMADKEKEEEEENEKEMDQDKPGFGPNDEPEMLGPSTVDDLSIHSQADNAQKETGFSSNSLWKLGKEKVMRPIKDKHDSKDRKSHRNPLQYLSQRKPSDSTDHQYEHMKDALPSNIFPDGQIPSQDNHFYGLCEGAWCLQGGESSPGHTQNSILQVPNGGNRRIWKCPSCAFEISSMSTTTANSATTSTPDSKHTNNSNRASISLWEGLKSLSAFSFGSTSSKRNASNNASPLTSRSNSASASASPILLPIQGSFYWTSPSSSRRPSAYTVNEPTAPNTQPCTDYDWDVGHGKEEPWQLHEQTGIRYRWTFLAKSHVRHSHSHFPSRSNTVPHRAHNRPKIRWNSIQDGPVYTDFEAHGSGFICLFCTLDPPSSIKNSHTTANGTDATAPTVHGTVDELLQHLRRHDGAKIPGRYRKAPRKEVLDHVKCVLGKNWLQKEVKLEYEKQGSRPVEGAPDDRTQTWDLWIPAATP